MGLNKLNEDDANSKATFLGYRSAQKGKIFLSNAVGKSPAG
jgi:hypothetical protein